MWDTSSPGRRRAAGRRTGGGDEEFCALVLGIAGVIPIAPEVEEAGSNRGGDEGPDAPTKARPEGGCGQRTRLACRAREKPCFWNLVFEERRGQTLRSIDQRTEPLEIPQRQRHDGRRNDLPALRNEMIQAREQCGTILVRIHRRNEAAQSIRGVRVGIERGIESRVRGPGRIVPDHQESPAEGRKAIVALPRRARLLG